MDEIRQAVERAKANAKPSTPAAPSSTPLPPQRPKLGKFRAPGLSALRTDLGAPLNGIKLDIQHLESQRIIAHNSADARSKAFDMLRTQVLQAMDQKNWQFLAVTSPTVGCGKTVTAINLALSIARQPERSVLLVDLDLRRPQVASCLGVSCDQGTLSVLERRASLAQAVIQSQAANHELLVLPAESSTLSSAELIASRAMTTMLQDIKRDYPSRIVIFDVPPMLAGDDVLALLPQIDCVLLVASVGTSTTSEIKECTKHLQASEVIRLVLNKSSESVNYYQ
jgi:protein-tyrosine kinase